jgi:murein DD-endopeptidase MepM/ murein hydrolase activator NlpD
MMGPVFGSFRKIFSFNGQGMFHKKSWNSVSAALILLFVYSCNYIYYRSKTSLSAYTDFPFFCDEEMIEISLSDLLQRNQIGHLHQKVYAVPTKGSLMRVLLNAGFSRVCVQAALSLFYKRYGQLGIGQKVTVTYRQKGVYGSPQLHAISCNVALGTTVSVMESQTPGKYVFSKTTVPLTALFTRVQGVIAQNLLQDLCRRGISQRQAQMLARALSSAGINWRLQLHQGDQYSFLCKELQASNGERAMDSVLMICIKFKKGNVYNAYRYQPPGSKVAAFYTGEGVCYCEGFLKRPIGKARLSSKFGSRKHPIFGCHKRHTGVDWAAAMGAPVMAAADGVVDKIGWYSGYGKYVRLRHNHGYSTAYGHLRAYAKNLSAGQVVKQGQTIGFVGSTGNATGPHLHFEVLKGSRFLNPLNLDQEVPIQLQGQQKIQFRQYVQKLNTIYNQAQNTL